MTPFVADYAHHVYPHLCGPRSRRDEIIESACRNGCRLRHSLSCADPSCRTAYQGLGYEIGAFPIAERAARQFISLPMFPELTSEQIEIVTTAIKEAVSIGVLA